MAKDILDVRPYGKLDVKSCFHRKVLHLGNSAWGALQRLNALSNDYMTDGWVDSHSVRQVCTEDDLRRLLEPFPWEQNGSPMLSASGSGFTIHGFLEWNKSKKEIEKLKRIRKDNGKKGGLAKARVFANQLAKQTLYQKGSKLDLDLDLIVNVPVDQTPPNPPSVPTPKLTAQELYAGAYGRGISRATNAPYAVNGWDGDLGVLIQTHFKALRGTELQQAIEDCAYSFAKHALEKGRDMAFFSNLRPKGCLAWKNVQPVAPPKRPKPCVFCNQLSSHTDECDRPMRQVTA